ncbi:MAG: hypothetical protein O4805_23485 [Trichodesmium sp. St16_bin2-tuft]|nr:hypothetical protein [Trichodesmium sp. St16_bin2-tuft]
MIEFKKQLQFDSLMVADSAFYTQENIQIVDKFKWLSRVLLAVKAATLLVKYLENKNLITSQIQEYNYSHFKKRWKTFSAPDASYIAVHA